MWESKMNKMLWIVCLVGSVLLNNAMGEITYIDADNANGSTTLNGAVLEDDVNYTLTSRSNTDDYWAYRTDRSDVNGSGIWVTDGGNGGSGVYDRETTDPLKVDFILPEAGVLYDLYVVIMNNFSGDGRWDIAARIGNTGDFVNFNRDSEEMTQAVAEDFDSEVTVSDGGDMTMKVLIGQYTTTTANEDVSIYVNGLDTWEIEDLDQRTRFDGVGYEVAPVFAVSPEDGETDVAVEGATVTWGGGYDPNAVGYYIYLGTDSESLTCLNSDPFSMVPVGTNSYTMGDIDMNTTYYWQIEISMEDGAGGCLAGDPNNIVSDVFEFTTVFSIPLITADPEDQNVSAGESVDFEVGYDSLTTASFAWYHSEDPNNDTPADDTYVADDEVLSLTSVTVDDEGYYYCVVSNNSSVDAVSGSGALSINRLVAYWTFDQVDYDGTNNLYLDKSGEGHDAEPNGVPTFTTGFAGEAVSIPCANGSGEVTTQNWATAGTWGPAELSGKFTVSFWINWYGPSLGNYDTQNIISEGIGGEGIEWRILTDDGGNIVLSSDNANIVYSGNFLEIDTWVKCTIAFDGSTAYFYKNGEYVSSDSFSLGDVEDGTLCLGGKYFDTTAEGWMNGDLDEVYMYNYDLTDVTIAEDYIADIPGSAVCVNSLKPDTAYDLNDDCIVDLVDFADFASNWLVSGILE